MNILSEARLEIEQANVALRERSPQRSARFRRELHGVFASIRATPKRFHPLSKGEKFRVVKLLDFPYAVIYSVNEGKPTVVALQQFVRNPGYWRD